MQTVKSATFSNCSDSSATVEFDEFAELWGGAWESVGRRIGTAGIRLAFTALQKYGLARIGEAVHAFLADPASRNEPPTISAVVALLQAGEPGDHPRGDEAWGVVWGLHSNEYASGFLTDPMRQAWSAASSVMEGDQVGGRKVFLAAYEKAVSAARRLGNGAAWTLSRGRDYQMLVFCVIDAINQRLISFEEGRQHVPELDRNNQGAIVVRDGAVSMSALVHEATKSDKPIAKAAVELFAQLRSQIGAEDRALSEAERLDREEIDAALTTEGVPMASRAAEVRRRMEEARRKRLKNAMSSHEQLLASSGAGRHNITASACSYGGCWRPGTMRQSTNGGGDWYCSTHIRM